MYAKTGTRKGYSKGGTQKRGAKKRCSKAVLKSGNTEGYSKGGAQKGVLIRGTQKGYSKRGYSKRGYSKRGYSKRGYSKRVLKRGTRKVVLTSFRWSGEIASSNCGVLAGSAWQCCAHRSNGPCSTAVYIGYSRRTHTTGALTGGSGWRLLRTTREHALVCTGTVRVLRQKRTSRVLARYSRVTCVCSGTVHVQRSACVSHAHVRDRVCVAAVRRCCGVLISGVDVDVSRSIGQRRVVRGAYTERYSAVLNRLTGYSVALVGSA